MEEDQKMKCDPKDEVDKNADKWLAEAWFHEETKDSPRGLIHKNRKKGKSETGMQSGKMTRKKSCRKGHDTPHT